MAITPDPAYVQRLAEQCSSQPVSRERLAEIVASAAVFYGRSQAHVHGLDAEQAQAAAATLTDAVLAEVDAIKRGDG
jgi:hypothetical protein